MLIRISNIHLKLFSEEIWRLRRKILTRIFAPKYYNNFVQVLEGNITALMTRLAAAVDRGDVSMWNYFSSFSLDSALGMNFNKNVIHFWICIKYCRTWWHLNPRLVNYRTSGYQFYHGAIAEDTRYKSNDFEHFESSQKVIEVTKYGKCIEDLFIKLIVNIKLY